MGIERFYARMALCVIVFYFLIPYFLFLIIYSTCKPFGMEAISLLVYAVCGL